MRFRDRILKTIAWILRVDIYTDNEMEYQKFMVTGGISIKTQNYKPETLYAEIEINEGQFDINFFKNEISYAMAEVIFDKKMIFFSIEENPNFRRRKLKAELMVFNTKQIKEESWRI